METGTKGPMGAYLCQNCNTYQSLCESEIERTIVDKHAFLDKWKCHFCEYMNEYRFPRW